MLNTSNYVTVNFSFGTDTRLNLEGAIAMLCSSNDGSIESVDIKQDERFFLELA